MTKKSASSEIMEAIRTVITGRKYVTSSLAERLAYEIESDFQKPLHESLSDREFQVMCMIASGKTVSDIAQELSLSIQSISTYRARILEKMKMKNNAELTRYVIENGLL